MARDGVVGLASGSGTRAPPGRRARRAPRAASNPMPLFAPVISAARPDWSGTSASVHFTVRPSTSLERNSSSTWSSAARGRLARLVDQVAGEHRVVLAERAVGVPVLLAQLHGHEAVAEPLLEEREALPRARTGRRRSAARARAAPRRRNGRFTIARSASLVSTPPSRERADRERQRRLRHHRREHEVVDGHREREAAGEAHADDADARARRRARAPGARARAATTRPATTCRRPAPRTPG